MTPTEYLAQFRKQPEKFRQIPEKRKLLAHVRKRYGLKGEEATKAAEKMLLELDYAEGLLWNLKPKLSRESWTLFEDGFIAVAEVEDDTPDAKTVELETGFAILINSGLHKFIYRIARVLSTRMVSSVGTSQPLDFRETVRLMLEAFWWFEHTKRATGPEYPITQEQIQFASLLTSRTMDFLFCHEVAHAFRDTSLKIRATFVPASMVGGAQDDHSLRLHIPRPPDNDEHDADKMGAWIALGFEAGRTSTDPLDDTLAYAGVEFGLQIYSVMERLGIPFSSSHPGAQTRLESIRACFRRRCDSDEAWQLLTQLSSQIERVFAAIADTISDPSAHAEFYAHQAQRVVEELDLLLEAARWSGDLPGQVAFDMTAIKIFRRAYPYDFLQHVARVAGEFFDISNDIRFLTDDHILQRISKVRLLLNFVNHWIGEPARSMIMAELVKDRSYLGQFIHETPEFGVDD